MKKTYLYLAIFIIFLISGCSSHESTSPGVTPSVAPSNTASSTDLSTNCGVEPNATAAKLQFPEKLSVTFPTEIPDYNPQPIVLPLVSEPIIYSNCISGNIEFYNTDTMKRVEISSEIDSYTKTNKCYMVGKENKYAIMTFDGKITSEFIYELFDGERNYVYAYRGYVAVTKTVGDMKKCGVADIRTGKTVIDMKYDDIYFYNNFVIAKDGDFSKFIDYNGNEFYEVKGPVNDGNRSSSSEFATSYHLDLDEMALFAYSTENTFYYRNGYYVLKSISGSTNVSNTKIWDSEKKEICNFYGEVFIGDNLIIRTSSKFTIVPKSGATKVVTLNDQYSWVSDASEENGFLYVTGITEGSNEGPSIIRKYNMDSEFIEITPDNELFLSDGVGRYPNSETYTFYDKNGNVLIPDNQYRSMRKFGPFVICYKQQYKNESVDVYNTSGKLLASSYLGVVCEVESDRMIIYKDTNTCMLLSADGTMVNIPINTPVTLRYISG